MTSSEPRGDREIIAESVMTYLERMRQGGQLDLEPSVHCRVCREPSVLGMVNSMLARAYTPTDVLGTLEAYNRTLPKRRQISYESVYNHTRYHFSVQEPANAVWREMAMRRYEEAGGTFATGVGTAVTYLAYLETMMARGYEDLVDPTVRITADQGMRAAVKFAEVQRKDEGLIERAQMLAKMNSVIELVRKFVPQEKWPELQSALQGENTVEAIEAVAESVVRMVDIQDQDDEEEDQR